MRRKDYEKTRTLLGEKLLMSDRYLVELEGLNSGLKNKVSRQDGSLKKMNMLEQSYEKDFPKPRYMEILPNLILEQFQKLTFSQEDSHVKTSVLLEEELESRGVVVHSGNIMPKLLGRYDRESHSLKMFQHSLIGDSTLSLRILPKSGMMRNGIIYQLPQLVHFIKGKDSLLLPTPVASDGLMGAIIGKNDKYYITKTGMPRKVNQKGKDGSVGLGRLVQMFPTPTTRDNRGKGKSRFDKSYFVPEKTSGQLNPQFVEWLMGFPIYWTEVEYDKKEHNKKAKPKNVQQEGMRILQVKGKSSTPPSGHNYIKDNQGIMPKMSQEFTHEGWNMGSEEDKEGGYMCNMQKDIHAETQQDRSQDLQQRMLECSWQNKLSKKVGYWSEEPGIRRTAEGVKNRVNRIRCLGNAVVPQVVEIFAKAIKKIDERRITRQ